MNDYDPANEYMHRGFLYTSDPNLISYKGLIQAEAERTGLPVLRMAATFAHIVRESGVQQICRKRADSGFRPDDAALVLSKVRAYLG